MIWWLVILGIFVAIAAGIYVPDWIRWAKWNRRRKRMTPGEARDLRPPVATPFWSSYSGLGAGGSTLGSGGSGDCGPGGFGGGGGSGGGGDGGGGGCD